MKTLKDFILEGNISNTERKYREFCQMCTGHNIDISAVSVKQTSKGNWAVYVGDKRAFTASRYILDSSVVDTYKIPTKED